MGTPHCCDFSDEGFVYKWWVEHVNRYVQVYQSHPFARGNEEVVCVSSLTCDGEILLTLCISGCLHLFSRYHLCIIIVDTYISNMCMFDRPSGLEVFRIFSSTPTNTYGPTEQRLLFFISQLPGFFELLFQFWTS